MALTRRRHAPGKIHHSDRGVRCACRAYRQQPPEPGSTAGMSREEVPHDDTAMERFLSAPEQ